ncbi:12709_t:CDS:2, partial [Funneliformis mosseae]
ESDYYNDELLASHNPFFDKFEISNAARPEKRQSPNPINSSTKKRRFNSFDDEINRLPSLSTKTTSSDTSSSESSDDDEGDNESFSLSEFNQKMLESDDDVDSMLTEFDIVDNLESLSFTDNLNATDASQKVMESMSTRQVVTAVEDAESTNTVKGDENFQSVMVQLEKIKSKEKEDELPQTSEKVKGEGKGDLKFPKAPMAGFTGRRKHQFLDMLDHQAFRARHQKVVMKRARGPSLSGGLTSLLSNGFKPTSMLG